jgi:hypothetical protein
LAVEYRASIDDSAKWRRHVLLGNNCSGKSTFIRAAAVALMGPNEALKSRHDFSEWVNQAHDRAFIRMELIQDKQLDTWAETGNLGKGNLSYAIKINRWGEISPSSKLSPNSHIWSGNKGWFSASYGPFRRFSGGSNEYQKLFHTSPLLARHLSVFGEGVALTETLEWLRELRFKQLESPDSTEAKLLGKIKQFLNKSA